MNKVSKFFILLSCVFLLFSCTTQITLQVNKDGSVSTQIYSTLGKDFEALIRQAQGLGANEPIFDVQTIRQELNQSGYDNISVSSTNGRDITIKTIDTIRESVFFNSGIIALKNSRMIINLNKKNMQSLYNMLDQDFAMYLDMLLAPVFNNEEMTMQEYEQLLGSFYGKSIVNELKKADVNLIIINSDGSKAKHRISLIELLTLNKSLQLE